MDENIARAAMAEAGKFNELITRLWRPFNPEKESDWEIHPEAFRFEPQGARLHLAIAPMPSRIGLITVPDAEDGDINGLAVVFAVGSEVGEGASHPGAPLCNHPEDLLYRQVMLKKFAGMPLSFDPIRQSNYYSPLVAVSERDIVAIDYPEQRHDYGKTEPWINMLGWQLDGIPESFVVDNGTDEAEGLDPDEVET